jgi:hypothetical protein
MDVRLDGKSGTGRAGGRDPRSYHPLTSLTWRVDVDHALEESAFRNTDPLCNHIPDQGTLTADVDTFGGIDVAMHGSQNHHLTGTDIGRHLPIAANRDAVARQVDCAHDFAVDIQRFGAYYCTLDLQALVNRYRISGCR